MAITRDSLLALRAALFRDLGTSAAALLQEAGIAGGGAFCDSEELSALLPLLETLADPDDPVAFVAALRGPAFGVDDDALYRFARSRGRFRFTADLQARLHVTVQDRKTVEGIDGDLARLFALQDVRLQYKAPDRLRLSTDSPREGQMRLIVNEANRGFAAAVNRGIHQSNEG